MTEINRREFIKQSATPLVLSALPSSLFAETAEPLSKMGIASTSFMGALIPGSPTRPGTGTAPAPNAPRPQGRDALEFLEKCHALGAGGVQTGLNGDLMKLRKRADELGMYLEGMVSI